MPKTNIIQSVGQLKPVVIDTLNSLKAKKIVKNFSFMRSRDRFPWIDVTIFITKKVDLNLSIKFGMSSTLGQSEFYIKERASNVELYFSRVTKNDVHEILFEQFNHRREGLQNEMAFEEILKIFIRDGFIESYKKSTKLEDLNEKTDWYIIRNGQKFGIDIKSSDYGVRKASKNGSVFCLKFDRNDDVITIEYIRQLKKEIKERMQIMQQTSHNTF